MVVPVLFSPVLLFPSAFPGPCFPELTQSVPREDGLVSFTASGQQSCVDLFSVFKLLLFVQEYVHSSPFCFCWSLPSCWTGQEEAAGVLGGCHSSLQVVVVLLCCSMGKKRVFHCILRQWLGRSFLRAGREKGSQKCFYCY